MPVSKRDATPDRLRPYAHHGVDLSVRGGHAVGDCPFCGKEGKFSVEIDTGLWRCFVCGSGTDRGGGNALVFLRLLWERSATPPPGRGVNAGVAMLSAERRMLDLSTLPAWGVCTSLVDSSVLIPGYGADGKLDQLYRRVRMNDTWRLLPTPGVWPEGKVHALHLPTLDFDPARPKVDVFEGPWDGMVWWETACPPDTNVVAVPGCNVWRDEWTAMCAGKHVTLWFDSDHPHQHGDKTFRAGYDGMVRIAKRLHVVAASVRYVKWGEDGYDPARPSGWDVRDCLAQHALMVDRREQLSRLLGMVEDAPADWFGGIPHVNGHAHKTVEAQSCDRWTECEAAWVEAMQWRQDMGDGLAVLLAVCASTQQSGNQLFLQLVGSAGSGKTMLCEGLLVSSHCHHLEHLTGFHSGWKGEDGKDCSLIARINGKTLVTPEADIMMSSPRFVEIMSQQRRIFDGKSGATYKNSSEDTLHVGLRTPWIMAGTPALMDTDQSRLGDRFLRFIIGEPGEREKRAILRKALRAERVAMLEQANGTAASLFDPKLRQAHGVTGGYVDWLRANVEDQLAQVDISEAAEERCIDLAELSADMRARPNEDHRKKEVHDAKELPTRLSRQNIRMASCLAVVLNKKSVDADVLRIVRKVALDTAHGHSLNIAQWLCSPNPKNHGTMYQEGGGLTVDTLAMWSGMTPERLHNYLMFLRKIDVLDHKKVNQTNGLWTLTDRVFELYLRVMGD